MSKIPDLIVWYSPYIIAVVAVLLFVYVVGELYYRHKDSKVYKLKGRHE